MAPVASRERGAPGSGSPRAGAGVHTPHTSSQRSRRARPTTRHRTPLVFTVTAAEASSRPGVQLQDLLLRDFHNIAVPGALPSASNAFLWITVPFLAPRFTPSYTSSMLTYHLAAPPALIRARAVAPGAFRARLTSVSVAHFLAARGHLMFCRRMFCLHSSELQAMAMAATLREEDDAHRAQGQQKGGLLECLGQMQRLCQEPFGTERSDGLRFA